MTDVHGHQPVDAGPRSCHENSLKRRPPHRRLRDQVWRLIADESQWPVWGRWSSVEIEGGGAHGLGSVRRLVQRPFTVRERVTEWQPGVRMSYELLEGMNARGYHATASLEDAPGGGTIVRWSSQLGIGRPDPGVYGPTHVYPFYAYAFPEGWFVVAARDETLIGSRLVSIGGTLVKQVESALRPLVPADNESGELIGVEDQLSTVEFLHGLGFVDDTSKPGFAFEKPDGSQMTVDLVPEVIDSEWIRSLNGYLMGDAPKAVARRGEPVWTRLDKPTKTFVLSYNDYTGTDAGSRPSTLLDARPSTTARRSGSSSTCATLRAATAACPMPLVEARRRRTHASTGPAASPCSSGARTPPPGLILAGSARSRDASRPHRRAHRGQEAVDQRDLVERARAGRS